MPGSSEPSCCWMASRSRGRPALVGVCSSRRRTVEASSSARRHAFRLAATSRPKGGGLVIGADCFIGMGCVITCKSGIDIGDDALIAEHVTIRDQDHAFPAGARIREAGFDTSPVTIGSDVWLAAKSSVLKGSRIGGGCVVGAHAVVKGVVPGNSVVAGIPARLVRERVHGR